MAKKKGKQIISLLYDLVYKIVFSCFLPINTWQALVLFRGEDGWQNEMVCVISHRLYIKAISELGVLLWYWLCAKDSIVATPKYNPYISNIVYSFSLPGMFCFRLHVSQSTQSTRPPFMKVFLYKQAMFVSGISSAQS